MKTLFKTTTAVLALMAFSFTTVETIKKEVDTQTSTVTWIGYKVTGSQHTGKISIKSGYFIFNNEVLTGGNFIIDMATIYVTDLKGAYKNKLEGHLKSDHFFGVEKFPEASLAFTKVESIEKNTYKVTGEITIKGKTEAVSFDLSVYGNKANASLKIDRSKFNVTYGSKSFFDGLKDKAIEDEFDILVDLDF